MITPYIRYILLSSAFITVFYLAYRWIFRKETNFKYLRLYLMTSVVLSLVLPFNSFAIHLPEKSETNTITGTTYVYQYFSDETSTVMQDPYVNWKSVITKIYIGISLLLIIRIFTQLIVLTIQYIRSEKIVHKGYKILMNNKLNSNFSFFKWIFICSDSVSDEELDQIITHEQIHASQYHSADLMVIELLSAVMWFNPFIWMMKNSIQLVHEYLADEGVLNTGFDRIKYQALMISQVAEERLVRLSSSFNYSLIKKRMKMMTQSKTHKATGIKVLALAPVSAVLFILLAVINGVFPAAADAKIVNNDPSAVLIENGNTLNHSQPVDLPGDTVKKQKIITVIEEDNKKDTVFTKTIEVVIAGDTSKTVTVIKSGDGEPFVTGYKNAYTITQDDGVYVMHKDFQSDSAAKLKVIVRKDESGNNEKQEQHIIVRGHAPASTDKDGNYTWVTRTSENNDNILYIIDGVEQKGTNPIKNLNPNDIESMEVLKVGDKMEKYAKQGFDAVILITTKKGK